MIDFYKNAPFKARGRIPFGVQHGTYLNTEERVRRAVKEWASRSASGAPASLPANASNTDVSYKELVESFQVRLQGRGAVVAMTLCEVAHKRLKTAHDSTLKHEAPSWQLQHQLSASGDLSHYLPQPAVKHILSVPPPQVLCSDNEGSLDLKALVNDEAALNEALKVGSDGCLLHCLYLQHRAVASIQNGQQQVEYLPWSMSTALNVPSCCVLTG
jgi:hypothetical protein